MIEISDIAAAASAMKNLRDMIADWKKSSKGRENDPVTMEQIEALVDALSDIMTGMIGTNVVLYLMSQVPEMTEKEKHELMKELCPSGLESENKSLPREELSARICTEAYELARKKAGLGTL
ncbi:MAG: hypothetical protein OXJ38_04950 [Gammaproteobacteria bacterium]|nr:hypothetical protein [Gammaproteobacteria bacterium]MDE0612009.1 hypothetical protein [Gammaproteobacteria bacterium]